MPTLLSECSSQVFQWFVIKIEEREIVTRRRKNCRCGETYPGARTGDERDWPCHPSVPRSGGVYDGDGIACLDGIPATLLGPFGGNFKKRLFVLERALLVPVALPFQILVVLGSEDSELNHQLLCPQDSAVVVEATVGRHPNGHAITTLP
nr:hypothetical protein [Rhizobium favelukesii]